MLSLYRKYRPAQFDELEGQEQIKQTLREACKQSRISHAYLFAGPRGTGKTSSARILAKAITCENLLPDGNPCNICTHCMAVNEGHAVDVVEIDAASHRGIDAMKELTSTMHYHPTYAGKRVYIIDEVHMLTKESFNALLKALEEPPSFVHFVLATTEAHKVLPTIISRCQFFQFQPLHIDEIIKRLEYILQTEERTLPATIISRIAQMAGGGMRDALTQLERVLSIPNLTEEHAFALLGSYPDRDFEELFAAISRRDLYEAYSIVQQHEQEGKDADQFVRGFLHFIHGQFAEAVSKRNSDKITLLGSLLTTIRKSIGEMQYADIPFLTLKLMIVDLCAEPTNMPILDSKNIATPKDLEQVKASVTDKKHTDLAESFAPNPTPAPDVSGDIKKRTASASTSPQESQQNSNPEVGGEEISVDTIANLFSTNS